MSYHDRRARTAQRFAHQRGEPMTYIRVTPGEDNGPPTGTTYPVQARRPTERRMLDFGDGPVVVKSHSVVRISTLDLPVEPQAGDRLVIGVVGDDYTPAELAYQGLEIQEVHRPPGVYELEIQGHGT